MVYIFLADGFEEIEALTPLDILRRAQIPVCTVGVDSITPHGAHNITVQADMFENDIDFTTMDAIILPGGMPGTINLENSVVVQAAIGYAAENILPIAAICAAPSILGHLGLLKDHEATCYPGFENDLHGAMLSDKAVVTDGNITTAKGAGVALEFALELVARLRSPKIAAEIRGAIQCR